MTIGIRNRKPAAFFSFFCVFLSFVGFAPVALAECNPSMFSTLAQGPISKLARVSLVCQTVAPQRTLLGYRSFVKAGTDFVVVVDPSSFGSEVLPAECLKCTPTEVDQILKQFYATKYAIALGKFTNSDLKESDKKPALIKNAGVDQAQKIVPGYFLTVDLCPSKSAGMDEQIFKSVENALVTKIILPPVPVGVSISGRWMLKHGDAMNWLLQQESDHRIHITWINHTLNHPFHLDKPLDHNFLLSQGVKLDREVLGLESLLLERGLIPSVFFRFPGLVASPALLEKLRSYMLIPLGTNAWMAKKEEPEPGSIILIHGNYNEELGVRDFLKWFSAHRDTAQFMELPELF